MFYKQFLNNYKRTFDRPRIVEDDIVGILIILRYYVCSQMKCVQKDNHNAYTDSGRLKGIKSLHYGK